MIFKELSTIQDDRHNAFPSIKTFGNTEFLAFRSARTHYPSKRSHIAIYKRTKGKGTWEKFQRISIKHMDVRDPEFGIINNTLCLVFAAAKYRKTKLFFSTYKNDSFADVFALPLDNHLPSKFITLESKTFLLTYTEKLIGQDNIHIISLAQKELYLIIKNLIAEFMELKQIWWPTTSIFMEYHALTSQIKINLAVLFLS